MRRMLRIFGWMGLGLSMALLMASLFMWIRSYVTVEHLTRYRIITSPEGGETTHALCVASAGGSLGLWAVWSEFSPAPRLTAIFMPDGRRIAFSEPPPHGDTSSQSIRWVWETRRRRDELPGPPLDPQNRGRWGFAAASTDKRGPLPPFMVDCPPMQFGASSRMLLDYGQIGIMLPWWLPAVAFGLWPVGFVARRVLRRRRYGAGLCPSCGYDLRATPEPAGPLLARCPECGRGTPPVAKGA